MLGKAPEEIPHEPFDVVILSKVLEHQRDRVTFLKEIIKRVKPKKILIRVPCFERDWRERTMLSTSQILHIMSNTQQRNSYMKSP